MNISSLWFLVSLLFGVASHTVLAYDQDDLDKFEKTGSCVKCDLSGISLGKSGKKYAKADLTGSDLSGSAFAYTDMRDANLTDTDLRDSVFWQVNFANANFTRAKEGSALYVWCKGK